jgi:zinc and cadmium transporter
MASLNGRPLPGRRPGPVWGRHILAVLSPPANTAGAAGPSKGWEGLLSSGDVDFGGGIMSEPAVFFWILGTGIAMAGLGLVGGVSLLLGDRLFRRLLLPFVAFSAGSLMGGAFLHMLPAAAQEMGAGTAMSLWVLGGFALFFALEQFLHWHHCHREASACQAPVTYLLLIANALHKLVGGMAVAGSFLVDVRLGLTIWTAAVAHEIPHELGDFAVMVHGGWTRWRALFLRVVTGMAFPIGGVLVYAVSFQGDTRALVPFAAGNFIYIAASDLIPEVNRHRSLRSSMLHFGCFALGVLLLLALRLAGDVHAH